MKAMRACVVPFLLLLGSIAFPTWCAAGATGWMPLAGGAARTPAVQAVGGDPGRVVVEVSVPGFLSDEVLIDGMPYAKVVLPGHVQMLRRGFPALPVVARNLIIPDEGTPAVRILAESWRELPTAPPVPAKGDLPRSVDPDQVPYEFAPLYREGGIWPEQAVELGRPFVLRDHRGVGVFVYPFRYDAGRGVLLALERMTLEVVTAGKGGMNVRTPAARRGVDPQFQRVYASLFLNADAAKYAQISTQGPMLVVCDDPLVSALQPFVEWKSQRGVPVEMLPVSATGGTASGIKTAISTRYESPAGLTYVVLVGDIAQVPTNTGTVEGADSDPMYGMVDGSDSYPDLFVSRISARNASEAQLQVAKFVRYEKQPDTGGAGAWYHRCTGIASNESGGTGIPDYERMELLRDDLLAYTFSDMDQIYQGQGGTTQGIADALDAGRSLVNYIGHGSGVSWSSVYWGISNIDALSNGWMQPWIVDVSCDNGDFSLTECFAEAWLRAGTTLQPTGAVAIYSASTGASWVPPTVMQAEVVDLLVAETEQTLGALYFSGAMRTLDAYPPPGTEGRKLVEQYNIFGDCSLVVRTDMPTVLAVSHPAAVPLFAGAFAVDTGLPGATACLYRDGVIHGAAVSDASGTALINLDVPLTTPGEVTLTVTAYNRVPYITVLPAIYPAVVVLDPETVDVGRLTPVTVTVYEADGTTPRPGIEVWSEGLDYLTTPVVTGADGVAVIELAYPYGPSLDVVGREVGESYRLFTQALGVNALPLGEPDLTVTTTFALADSFGLNLPGTLETSTGETGITLHAFLPDGTHESVAGSSLTVTPTVPGEVTGIIALIGHDLYQESFPVIEARGTLAGTVYAEGVPLAGATVRGYDAGDQLAFTAESGPGGAYAVAEEIPVGAYTLRVDHFGHLPYAEALQLDHGPNLHDVLLAAAPAGDLAGVVTALDSGLPLAAELKLYRFDTQELYAQTTSDPADGTYALPELPYFTYRLTVKAARHIPASVEVIVDGPVVTRDFALEPTIGDLLILDDAAKIAAGCPPKLDKYGDVVAAAYEPGPERSAAELSADLEALGYMVTEEDAGISDPLTWTLYDLLVLASGNNQSPVADAGFRADLEAYVTAGGHILVEGGEVGYDALRYPGYPSFAAAVLHCANWQVDDGGDPTVSMPDHPVMSVPNELTGTFDLNYAGYGDADVLTPAAEATGVGAWTGYPAAASVVVFDPNPAPEGGQIVYFGFNYAALSRASRTDLLQNSVQWLLTPEVGDAGVAGRVTLVGGADNAGVLVRAEPGGGQVLTGADGTYLLVGLFAGSYTIRASKEGWETASVPIELAAGQQLTGVNLFLAPVQTEETCRGIVLAIPDANPAGVADTMAVALGATVKGVAVFVDITHTYQGDLKVDLVSPAGTLVQLHDRTGGGTDDIHGWYPDELTPAGNLDDFLDEGTDGLWILKVADLAGADLGTLNGWCLRLTYGNGLSDVPEDPELTRAVALEGNVPNPFNPQTTIRFALPRSQRVDLAVYDLQGRRVAVLVAGLLPAGRHEAVWRGTDEQGHRVASGLYLYRLQTEDLGATRKMLLLK